MNRSIGYNHRKHGNGGHGTAVSLPQNNHDRSMRDVNIARLIVGKRHCRVLISLQGLNSSLQTLDHILSNT